MNAEDDTFKKLKKPSFEEMYEIWENKRSHFSLNELMKQYFWEPEEFQKQLWSKKNRLILGILITPTSTVQVNTPNDSNTTP
jgi:hypothetical protein